MSITTAASTDRVQAEIGWLALAHEVNAREAVAMLTVSTSRANAAPSLSGLVRHSETTEITH